MIHDLFATTPAIPMWSSAVAKTSYFFSGVAFLHGMSNLFYMPLIIKYGRRPVYIVSTLIYGSCLLWAGLAKSYSSELVARLLLGFAGGAADCLAPLTITDVFFLHERGLIMRYSFRSGGWNLINLMADLIQSLYNCSFLWGWRWSSAVWFDIYSFQLADYLFCCIGHCMGFACHHRVGYA